MLLLVTGIFLLLCFLWLLGATYLQCSRAEYPAGIANAPGLRRLHGFISAITVLGRSLEKLGVGSEVGVLRFLGRLIPQKVEEDPELFIKNLHFDSVPVRVYQPRAPSAGARKAVLYFHGGGFVLGSIDSSDGFCQYIAKHSGAVVVSVGYRLAPEHSYPAPFQDCLNAAIHFMKNALEYGVDPSCVITCGESAGGNLAAAVSQALVIKTDIPKLLAQVLIYPVLQMIDIQLPAYQQNAMVPPLFRDNMLFLILNYISRGDLSGSKGIQNGSHVPPELRKKLSTWLNADNIPEEFKTRGYKPHVMSAFNKTMYEMCKPAFDPSCSPLLAEDSAICQLPKTYILTCEFDVLRDDGILYKKRLEDNGVSVTWYHIKDGFHGIVNFFYKPNFDSGKRAVDNFVNFIKDA